jgi:hypothetical protein
VTVTGETGIKTHAAGSARWVCEDLGCAFLSTKSTTALGAMKPFAKMTSRQTLAGQEHVNSFVLRTFGFGMRQTPTTPQPRGKSTVSPSSGSTTLKSCHRRSRVVEEHDQSSHNRRVARPARAALRQALGDLADSHCSSTRSKTKLLM